MVSTGLTGLIGGGLYGGSYLVYQDPPRSIHDRYRGGSSTSRFRLGFSVTLGLMAGVLAYRTLSPKESPHDVE